MFKQVCKTSCNWFDEIRVDKIPVIAEHGYSVLQLCRQKYWVEWQHSVDLLRHT